MKMESITFGRRVLKNGLILATTLITCIAVQADEDNKYPPDSGAPQGAERSRATSDQSIRSDGLDHGNKSEHFVRQALMGSEMEIQMGQLAQQKGQNQEVKNLGQKLAQDHTQVKQQLEQIAKSRNISTTEHPAVGLDAHKQDKHAKHQEKLSKLQNLSGAEFDQEFVRLTLAHHKKCVAESERVQQQIEDPQLKSLVQQTLPKLREHLRMAQSAARNVGVDESTIAAEELDNTNATGAPATRQSGSDKPRSSIDYDIDKSNGSASVDVDAADKDGKIFQKGDGRILGLPTSKTDGTYLGVIPKPDGKKDSAADASIDVNVNSDASVGGAAKNETGKSTDKDVEVEVDVDKK